MVTLDNGKRRPPYPPYSQWQRLLETLRHDAVRRQLPSRIDNSYLKKLKVNASAESNLQSALAFLGLVDAQRHPTDALKHFLSLEGPEARRMLKQIVESAYRPVLSGLLPNTATPDHLAERFKTGGSQDEVGRKGMTFYVRIAKDAGIGLSEQFRTRDRQPKTTRAQKKRSNPSRPAPAPPPQTLVPENDSPRQDAPYGNDMMNQLLDKFPDYDPTWDEEQVHLWRGSLAFLMAEVRSHPRPSQDAPDS